MTPRGHVAAFEAGILTRMELFNALLGCLSAQCTVEELFAELPACERAGFERTCREWKKETLRVSSAACEPLPLTCWWALERWQQVPRARLWSEELAQYAEAFRSHGLPDVATALEHCAQVAERAPVVVDELPAGEYPGVRDVANPCPLYLPLWAGSSTRRYYALALHEGEKPGECVGDGHHLCAWCVRWYANKDRS